MYWNSKLYEIIRTLRESRGWTQEKLAEKVGVNPQSVKGWESLIKKYRSMPKLEHLLKMCDLFECDLDYLTGRLKERTHDIHYVHEYTGLTEDAITKITNKKKEAISEFIENPCFSDFIDRFGDYVSLLKSLKNYEQFEKGDDNVSITIGNGKEVILPPSLALSLFQQRLESSLVVLCQRAMAQRMTELIRSEKDKK